MVHYRNQARAGTEARRHAQAGSCASGALNRPKASPASRAPVEGAAVPTADEVPGAGATGTDPTRAGAPVRATGIPARRA